MKARLSILNLVSTSRAHSVFIGAIAGLLASQSVLAAIYTYTPGSAVTDLWSAGTNWDATPVSALDTALTFVATNGTVLEDSLVNINTNDLTGDFLLNILDLQGTGPATGAGTLTIAQTSPATALSFVSNGIITPVVNLNALTGTAGLTYNVNTDIKLTNDTLFTGDGTAVFNFGGVISDAGKLTKSGTSVLTLKGANTYTGTTTLSAGTLIAGNASALGAFASAPLKLDGGILDLAINSSINAYNTTVGGSTTIKSNLSSNGAGISHTMGTLSIGAHILTLLKGGNVASGTAGLTFGATTLTGASVFSLGAGTKLTVGTVANGANTATFTGAGSFAQTGVWGSGAGGITLDSNFSGTVTLNQANTYTGTTTLNAGTLFAGVAGVYTGTTGSGALVSGAFGRGPLILNGGTLGANVNIGNATTVNANIAIGGTGRLEISGPWNMGGGTRTLTLNRANPFSAVNLTANTALQFNTQGSGPQVSVANGTMRLVVDAAVLATSYSQANFFGNVNFTANAGLTVGDRVVTTFNNATLLGTASSTYAALTLESGGYFNMAKADLLVSQSQTVFSLAGTGGTITNLATAAGTATLTINGSATTSFAGSIVNGNALGSTASGGNNTFSGFAPVGVVAIVKTGSGMQTLSGTSSYTGTTAVDTGTLIAGSNAPSGSSGAFGNATSEISLGTAGGSSSASILIGGAFDVGRNIRIPTSNTTDAGTRALTLGGNTAANSIFSGNIILGTNSQAGRGVTLTAANGGQVTFSGVIQNPTSMDATAYTVTKSGAGTVVLSNANNSYSGITSINAGILSVSTLANGSANSNIGASSNASANLVLNSGTFQYNGSNVSTDRSFSGNGSGVIDVSQSGTTLTMTGTSFVNFAKSGTGILDLTGAHNALNGLVVNAGTLVLSLASGNAANTAVTINGGTLKLGSANTGNTDLIHFNSTLSMSGSGVFDLNGHALEEFKALNGGASSIVTNSAASGTSDLQLGANGGAAGTFAGIIQDGANAKLKLTKLTSLNAGGLLTLTGANTYSGGTLVSGGTLTIGTGGTLGASTGTLTVNSTNTGSAGGAVVLNLATGTDTTVETFAGTVSGVGNTATVNNGGSGRNFTVNQTAVGTYAGVIAGAGSFTLGDLSTNKLTLSGANTYTGGTTIKAGTLIAGVSDTSGTAGAFGGSSRAVSLGDTTGSNNASLLIGGAFTVGNTITVQTGSTSNTLTLGGSTAAASSFTGANIFLGSTGGVAVKDATFVAATGGSVDFTGVIRENVSGVGDANVTVGDATNLGTVKFSNTANAYDGMTTINGGTLEAKAFAANGSSSSIGNGSAQTLANSAQTLIINGGTLKFTGTTGNGSTNRLFTIGTSGATIDGSSSDNTALTFTNTGSLATTAGASDRTLTLTGTTTAAALNSITSVIVDPTGGGKTALTKSGSNTWVLGGANTFSGATSVTAGTLKVTDSIGNSAVTVTGTGTTLASGTTGTIGSSVTVNSGAILAAGDNAIGTATVGTGGTTLNSGSIFSWDLNVTTPGDTASASSYDKVLSSSLAGDIGASAVFAVVLASGQSFDDTFWTSSHSWDNIFSTDGSALNALGMSSVFSSFTYNGSVSAPVNGAFTFTGPTGSTLSWSAVPEPSSAIAGLLLAAGLFRRSRRNDWDPSLLASRE